MPAGWEWGQRGLTGPGTRGCAGAGARIPSQKVREATGDEPSDLRLQAPLPHPGQAPLSQKQFSLTKQKFKGKIIKNFRTEH